MKIIYVYPALTTVGGADRVIVDKANYFAEKCDFEVFIITAHQKGRQSFFPLSDKIKHIDLDVNFGEQYDHTFFIRVLVYFKLLLRYKKRLSKILNDIKADFTLTTISRDVDFLLSIKDGSIKIAEAHVPKKFLRNLHLMQNRNILYKVAGKIWSRRLEKVAKKFSAFVVLTQEDADTWSKIRFCNVIPNSLPFYPKEKSACKGWKIISVGRLDEQKGYCRLIEAWALVASSHPGWKLNIYGEGALKNSLNKLILDKGISDSLFLKDPVNNIIDKYVESSFYVMSSRFEGFGMVLIEAMACGLPVIAFNCPAGLSNLINNNEDGFLVENGNIQQLAERITYLIDHEEFRIQMGQKARENVKRYSQDVIMQQWIDLFKSLKGNI